MDMAYTDFFLENKASLDNNYFFNHRQERRIAFFPDRGHRGDGLLDRNTIDLDPHMGKAFVDMTIPRARYSLSPHRVTRGAAPGYRNVLSKQLQGRLAFERRCRR